MSEPEALPPDVWIIASLKEILEAQKVTNQQLLSMQNELASIRKSQEPNTIHLKYEVDLSVARTDNLIADFDEMGVKINSITIPKVPDSITIKLNSTASETIELEAGGSISLGNQEIRRIYVTNSVGSGIVYIHVFGKV